MNETSFIISFLHANALHAHVWIFSLLIVGAFFIPISEDILVISAGLLAALVVPENRYFLFFFAYFGALFAAWITYGLGRFLGPKILQWPWITKIIKQEQVNKVAGYYHRYGLFVLIIGRFIPFGARTTLFFSAGAMMMPFSLFVFRDAIACSIAVSVLFSIGYFLGMQWPAIMELFQKGALVLLVVAGLVGLIFFLVQRYKTRA